MICVTDKSPKECPQYFSATEKQEKSIKGVCHSSLSQSRVWKPTAKQDHTHLKCPMQSIQPAKNQQPVPLGLQAKWDSCVWSCTKLWLRKILSVVSTGSSNLKVASQTIMCMWIAWEIDAASASGLKGDLKFCIYNKQPTRLFTMLWGNK